MKVAVVGGGVAGLSAVAHLLEMWEAYGEDAPEPLEIFFLSALIPKENSDGSGIGGKAMSRSYEGYYDEAHAMPREPIYGPMLPKRGTVPHGYHVMWDYRNLRRLLGDHGDGMGLLRPPPRAGVPGGASVIASFQGNVLDPTPGGPGIALVGLVDPEHPATATRPSTRALLRLHAHPVAGLFRDFFGRLFGREDGVDPMVFSDLLFTHEMDLEMRLSLIFGAILAHGTDPERTTHPVDGVPRPLQDVDYHVWIKAQSQFWAAERIDRLEMLHSVWREGTAILGLAEVAIEGSPLWERFVRLLIPDSIEAEVFQVATDVERIFRDLPRALKSLLSGDYPVADTLHMRFAPDATFTSPYAFDAATAVRSLQFCFLTPRSARAWSADGAHIQRLWLRYWQRIREAASRAGVTLREEEGRALSLSEDADGATLAWTGLGHHGGPGSALGWPHVPDISITPPPAETQQSERFDYIFPTMNPGLLSGLLPAPKEAAARESLRPLRYSTNETLELFLWLREPIRYSEAARKGLSQSCITGLEGAFCLLADYREGLWSPDALAWEHPFDDETPYSGALIETCGAFDDVFACADRDDAFGWPKEVKEVLRDLLSKPEFFSEMDPRPWMEDRNGWYGRRASGTWSDSRATDPGAFEDWVVASRWLVWGFVRQLSQVQSLGSQAVRQFKRIAALLDPNGIARADILAPPKNLRKEIRYVVMRNCHQRNRIFSPGAGVWDQRQVSGLPLPGMRRVFPAGDWTRNGVDIVCMEGACLSGMRAARAVHQRQLGDLPPGTPDLIRVMPKASWYEGVDPMQRG